MRATNDGGDSAYSNESCATTPLPPPDTKFRVERATGNILTDGSYEVSEIVEPGDVVEPDPNKPKHYRKARPRSTTASGVISTQPGMTMAVAPARPMLEVPKESYLALDGISIQLLVGQTQTVAPLVFNLSVKAFGEAKPLALTLSLSRVLEHRPASPRLALVGRVPVRATTENGVIQVGDLLTVSITRTGYAMRCAEVKHCEGTVIGKALEALDKGTGIILMLILR